MRIQVGEILSSSTGSLHNIAFDHSYDFGGKSFTLTSPLHIEGHMFRDNTSIIVVLTSLEGSYNTECPVCSSNIANELHLGRPVEREFFEELPREYIGEELQDVFLIDMHKHAIDVTEMVRQEVELRVPQEKLCTTCQKNQETKEKEVLKSQENGKNQQPFANLKDLLGQ